MDKKPIKPLGYKAYGSTPHLPGSRQGRDDIGLSVGQAKICLEKTRDKWDLITVTPKLDGSNCAVAKINGEIVGLIRAGYPAVSSRFKQHQLFNVWVIRNYQRFNALLQEGERAVGECLIQAHGTKYTLHHEPFVIFDIFKDRANRYSFEEIQEKCGRFDFVTPVVLHCGGAIAIKDILERLEPGQHGEQEEVEGAVWRVERKGVFDFNAKFVRSSKVDGKYLESSGQPPIWHWGP